MRCSSAPRTIFLHTDSIDPGTMQISSDPENRDKVSNVETMIIPLNSLERAVPGRNLFSIYPTILQPKAKGIQLVYLTNECR